MQCVGFSLQWFLLWIMGSRTWDQWCMGLVVPGNVESSWTHVPCIGRQILNHSTTREVRGHVLDLNIATWDSFHPIFFTQVLSQIYLLQTGLRSIASSSHTSLQMSRLFLFPFITTCIVTNSFPSLFQIMEHGVEGCQEQPTHSVNNMFCNYFL